MIITKYVAWDIMDTYHNEGDIKAVNYIMKKYNLDKFDAENVLHGLIKKKYVPTMNWRSIDAKWNPDWSNQRSIDALEMAIDTILCLREGLIQRQVNPSLTIDINPLSTIADLAIEFLEDSIANAQND